MTHAMSKEASGAEHGQDVAAGPDQDVGPDPAIGAGIALLGIFLMGVGGAQNAHYLFNFGVLVAVLGAVLFVLFVTVTAMKQRRAAISAGAGHAPDSGSPPVQSPR